MPNNDVILLADMLERDRRNFDHLGDDHDSFFTAKHYLRHYAPTADDIVSGLVDGRHDGGIDALYIFVNQLCVRDDAQWKVAGRSPELDLFILQVKNTKSFGEDAINRLVASLPKLLDFARDETELAKQFNPWVIEITRRFLETYRRLEMPSLRVHICFASLKAEHLHPDTKARASDLVTTVNNCFGGAEVEVDFLDASNVADMARERPIMTRELALAENPISTSTAGGYVAVVRLSDYERFITDQRGRLDASLFEANVRDYEGDTSVNKSIQDTLIKQDEDVDFWWLNNGVTIVVTRVQPAGKLLQLDAPQIVNGLQTSNEIFKSARTGSATATDGRAILVKVIQASDDAVRDRIIRATNSQTSFGPSALRATDKVQRQIEEFLGARGLFYERRRRHYFNQGAPADQIVSIDQMGQALLSTLVQFPYVARGEASRIFEGDYYDLLFAPSHPIQAYAAAIDLSRHTRAFLNGARHTRGQAEDLVHQLSMLTAIALTRRFQPSANDLVKLLDVEPPAELQATLLKAIQDEYYKVSRVTGEVMFDRMAKDRAITKSLVTWGKNYLTSGSRGR